MTLKTCNLRCVQINASVPVLTKLHVVVCRCTCIQDDTGVVVCRCSCIQDDTGVVVCRCSVYARFLPDWCILPSRDMHGENKESDRYVRKLI